MSQPGTLNGMTIKVAVDDLSASSFARPGGLSPGIESACFVSTEEFLEAGGKKGSIISFTDSGKVTQVQKISDFQGVLYLQLAPFKP